jgi:adenylate cyclase
MDPHRRSAGPAAPGGRGRRLLQLWLVGLAASLAVTGASAMGYLERLQVATLDLFHRLGGQRFPSEIVIVAVDDAAFAGFGGRQPIPRDYLARVVRGLERSGAGAVGLDIALSIPTAPADDAALAEAIRAFGRNGVSRVVLVDGPPPESGPLAEPAFLKAAVRGSDRVPVDEDGLIRRVAPMVVRDGRPPLPALGLAVLAHLRLADPGISVAEALARPGNLEGYPSFSPGTGWRAGGGASVPLDPGVLWRVPFVGPAGSFLTLPSDAVAALGTPRAPEVAEDNPLRGRIVLVGATFAESRDFFPTPVGRLTGVEVHANIAHMLATRSLLRPAGWLTGLGIQVAAVLVAGLLLVRLGPRLGTIVALLLTGAIGIPSSYLAFHGAGYAVDFVLPVAATVLLGVGAQALGRRRVRNALSRYVGREVMAAVLAEDHSLQGDQREVSVLVSDLRGFTTLSETLPPDRVAAHLNEYFPAMLDAILAHRGMVNDFIGDGILAVFGAPLRDQAHAWQAARAAVGMQAALERLNRAWAGRGTPTLRMGIGIHSGVVFAGNVGGEGRLKYTVVGDTVNVAARLEALNKDLGTTTLITEETRQALGGRAETRYRGEVPVKGRGQPLRVYELRGLRLENGPGQTGG